MRFGHLVFSATLLLSPLANARGGSCLVWQKGAQVDPYYCSKEPANGQFRCYVDVSYPDFSQERIWSDRCVHAPVRCDSFLRKIEDKCRQ